MTRNIMIIPVNTPSKNRPNIHIRTFLSSDYSYFIASHQDHCPNHHQSLKYTLPNVLIMIAGFVSPLNFLPDAHQHITKYGYIIDRTNNSPRYHKHISVQFPIRRHYLVPPFLSKQLKDLALQSKWNHFKLFMSTILKRNSGFHLKVDFSTWANISTFFPSLSVTPGQK